MIHSIRIWLWGIVSELEFQLYPWKTETPPEWVQDRYVPPPDYEKNFNDDWLKSQEERISRLQDEMKKEKKEIHNLHIHYQTGE